VVIAPTVRITEPNEGGVNAAAVEDALANGGAKKKMKAYRRSDSSGGNRSRSATKELALPADDSLMCPPSFLTGLNPELEIQDGTRLELRVSVKGDPDPQVVWTKDGKDLNSNDIMEVKYKNGVASITINEIYPEDGGRYACKATNTKGSVETATIVKIIPSTANGSAAAHKAANPPRVYKHIESLIVNDGTPVRLECTITGGSQFDVVWLHNEKEIKPSKDFAYVNKGGNVYALEIQEIFPEDGGTYTCEAFNDVGECFSTCSLIVVVPGDAPNLGPNFKTFPKSLTLDRGLKASFTADLDKSAETTLWMKDGKPITEQAGKFRITSTGTRISLEISNTSQADSGQYAVIVSNKKGENKVAFSVNVH
jgi:hypothetical protein